MVLRLSQQQDPEIVIVVVIEADKYRRLRVTVIAL